MKPRMKPPPMHKRAITHIFFDLHHTLIDGRKLHPCYSAVYGAFMAERYGLTADLWMQANRRIEADWDSYFADLDLEGEDGLAHLWEGLFRTTRAMFRLANVAEPAAEEIHRLVREIPEVATSRCDAFYPDARLVVPRLYAAGYTLGVATHAITPQARGTVTGGGMLDYFAGPFACPDAVGRFSKDEAFFSYALQAAQVAPQAAMLVDDSLDALRAARRLGMATAHILRSGGSAFVHADCVMVGTLKGLLTYLKVP